jgi:hypothetical protein
MFTIIPIALAGIAIASPVQLITGSAPLPQTHDSIPNSPILAPLPELQEEVDVSVSNPFKFDELTLAQSRGLRAFRKLQARQTIGML